MTATHTTYTSHGNAPRLSLSEQRIAAITTQIDAFSREIDAGQAELLRAREVLSKAYAAPERAAAVADDIEKMHRRLQLTRDLRVAAIADRDIHERQVLADHIASVRADWDRIGAGRTAKANELVGAIRLACALIMEIDSSADDLLAVLDRPLEAGLSRNQFNLRRETIHDFVLELFSALLPQDLWILNYPRPSFGHPRNVTEKLPDFVDGHRRAGLLAFDQALERVTQGRQFGAGQALGPGNAAAESLRQVQRRAAADGAENGIA